MSRAVTIAKVVLPLVLLFAAGPTRAGIHQVWDEAHAFKPETILQVDQLLDEIHEKFHKDLMIETFASIPDDLRARSQAEEREKFFENWGDAEGGQLRLNGMLILITLDPRHIHIEIGFATRQKAFTVDDRAELLPRVTSSFRKGDRDKGILDAVQFVRDRVEKNLSQPSTTSPATQPVTAPNAGVSQQSK